MNIISIIYEAAAHAGVSTSSIGPRLGKNRSYVARIKTAGSDPSTANAARMLEACGWKLVALPADKVPDGALEVSPTPTTDEDKADALKRRAEKLRRQADALLAEAEGI